MENIGWQHCVLFVAKLCTSLLQNTEVIEYTKSKARSDKFTYRTEHYNHLI